MDIRAKNQQDQLQSKAFSGLFFGLFTERLTVTVLAIVLAGCDARVTMKEAPIPQISVNNLSKYLGTPGDELTLVGDNFDQELTLTAAGKSLSFQLLSSRELRTTIPAGPPGEFSIDITNRDGEVFRVSLFREGVDHPLMDLDASAVCLGTHYYNRFGELLEGTRPCIEVESSTSSVILEGHQVLGVDGQLPVCQGEGTTNCYIGEGLEAYRSDQNLTAIQALPVQCSADGQSDCLTSASFPATQQETVSPGLIQFGTTIAGITGTLSYCKENQEQDCIIDGGSAFFAVTASELVAANIRAGIVIGGVDGNITLPSPDDVRTAVGYGANGTELRGTIVLPRTTEVAIGSRFGASGSEFEGVVALSPGLCDADTFQDCVASGSLFATRGCNTTGEDDCFVSSSGSLDAGDLSNLIAENIRQGTTILGVTGNLLLPTPSDVENTVGYGTEGSEFAGNMAVPLATQVATGQGYGANGSELNGLLDFAPATCNGTATQGCLTNSTYQGAIGCSSNGQDDCFVVSSSVFDAANLTGLNAGDIKRGIAIAGVTGNFPSAASPLPRYTDSGASNAVSGSDITDLTSSSFHAAMSSAASFEYWDSTGRRHTGTGDNALTPTAYADDVSIFGTAGQALRRQCTATTSGPCTADSACRWTGSACEIDPWNIKVGVVIDGQTGALKSNCRNRANSLIYNTDLFPPTNADVTSGSAVHWWDTIDHQNNNWIALPSDLPVLAGWSSDNVCGSEEWEDVTPDGACNTGADDCMMKDRLSGLTWTESNPITGTEASKGNRPWGQAMEACEQLNFGGYSDWRLPTQMEMHQAYSHGIRELAYVSGTSRPGGDTKKNNWQFITDESFWLWSSTSKASNLNEAYGGYIMSGLIRFIGFSKDANLSHLCVRP